MKSVLIALEITDRDGGIIDVAEYASLEELLDDWPYAECQDASGLEWPAWVGGRKQYV
jgi:hypothetical protein